MRPTLGTRNSEPGLLLFALAFALLSLACGSFAPRPSLEPTPWPTWTPLPPTATPTPRPQAIDQPTATPTVVLSAAESTPAAPPIPTGNVVVGQKARIVARTGVNIREQPSAKARLIGRFGSGVVVMVLAGPAQADDFVWWQVDDQLGRAGWVAAGDKRDAWIDGEVGEPRPVNRAVRLNDTVAATPGSGLALAIRTEPGRNGFVLRRVVHGTQLEIQQGPVTVDGFRWWEVRRQDGLVGWAAEGDGSTRWLSPIE